MATASWAVLAATACALVSSAATSETGPLLDPVFGDNAVLQRDRPIPVWGKAPAGESVDIEFADARLQAVADAEGAWRAELPAHAAGGPFVLSIKTEGGARASAENILIGDLFLCSGQSNMELPVRRSLDADSEIRRAEHPTIRMLSVKMDASATPLEDFRSPAPWRAATPDTVGEFSAACFYFARELQNTVNVPIGLINASWGGSRLETWLSRDGAAAAGVDAQKLEVLSLFERDAIAAAGRWGEFWQDWWSAAIPAEGEPWAVGYDDQQWATAPSLGFWSDWGDAALKNFTGMVWYRTSFSLTASQAAAVEAVSLGAVDEVEQTWVNGVAVGGGSGGDRRHRVPTSLFREGENVIVVNVLNTWGPGGLIGPEDQTILTLKNGRDIRIVGPWRYRAAPRSIGDPPRAPWEPLAGISMAYNGMIAPLGEYGLKGVLWYQGESNTGDAAPYQQLLAGLMADWRRRFKADLPFLVVQLAGFGAPPTTPMDSGWAALRSAQARAVAEDSRAGLAIALDVGDRFDIHPPNKQEVGRRLARAARRVVYGENIAPSGPTPARAMTAQSDIIVAFADIDQGLVVYGAEEPVGFELCSDAPAICRYARARVEDNRVRLSADVRTPTRVRYCWADNPVCTLYDGNGLPAGPFEIAVQRP